MGEEVKKLVERLTEGLAADNLWHAGNSVNLDALEELLTEAANTLERAEDRIEVLEAEIYEVTLASQMARRDRDRAEAQVEAMRKALEQVRDEMTVCRAEIDVDDWIDTLSFALSALASSTPESSVGAEPVLFVGWAALAPNGNVRLWSRDKAKVDKLASAHGLEIVRLVRAPLLGEPMKATAALYTALGHIEHMSAWIADQGGGYSFESLGEDMGDMRAAVNAAHAPAVARSAQAGDAQ